MSASAGRVLLLFKGEYDGSATYAPMDVVKYGVSSFVCKQESTGNLPTNTTYWQVLAQGISNMSPEAIGIGYGISSDSGSARTATLSDYNLTPNGIVAVTFGADVPANATLNINSQGAKPIYFRGSAIVANVIKGGDTVTFAYDGTHYDILCIDGGAGHKILNSAGTELTQRDGLQFTDGLEATDDAQGAKTKVGMYLPIVPRATWDAMTEQEKTAYIASHYRFGVEQPDTSGVINAEYMKLLWENPNTTQAFSAQNVTLNSADYDLLIIIYKLVNTSSYQESVIIQKGKGAVLNIAYSSGNSVLNYHRLVSYVSDTSLSFDNCYLTLTSGTQVSNADNIPIAIYGIKASFQFKVNAIASNLSTRADHCFLDDETTTVEDKFDDIGGGVELITDRQSTGTVTVSNLSQFKQISFILAWKFTGGAKNCCAVSTLPLNLFKQNYNLQCDVYDGTTRRFASVQYVSDTQVNIDTVTQISGNWNLYLIGIK